MAFSRTACCSLSSVACLTANASGSHFFERQAVALERKALPLKRHAQRIEMPERQWIEFSLKTLDDLLARQRFDRGHAHERGDHLVTQHARPSAFMTDLDQQSDHTLFAPRVGLVVNRLSAHTKLRADGHGSQLTARKHQQSGCPHAHVPVGMVDRQLLQGLLLGFSQYNDALYVGLRRMRFAEVNKLQTPLPATPSDYMPPTGSD